MVAKYLYAYITLGIVFFALAIYRLVTQHQFTLSVVSDIVPAIAFFYLAYKSYKTKNDQELM